MVKKPRAARQVAEHMATASAGSVAGIAFFIGVPGPVREESEFPSVDEALGATQVAYAKFMVVVRAIPEDKLKMEGEAPRFGKNTISGFLGMAAQHLHQHS